MLQRRITAVASAAVLAFALGACGSDDTTDTGGSKLEGTGPITFVTGKDTSGNLQKQIDAWNAEHPDEKARVIELPESADQQRQQMVQNAQTKSDEYTVLNLDVIWTAEFAANGWVDQLPEGEFPLDKLLPAPVETGKYFGKLYAVPVTSDGGMLYYRKDLLTKAGVQAPPKTWAEMKAACDKVKALPEGKGMGCYAGQFDKYEGLTVNFSEAVNSAGGEVIGSDGKPNVNTAEAKQGLSFLVDGFKSGLIPRDALTYKEEENRRAWQDGKLIFSRNWPYMYNLSQATDGTSKVAGKFDVAPLPGLNDLGASTLGGHNFAVSKFAKNKKSAVAFIKFMSDEKQQRSNLEATSQAPTWASIYDDAELAKKAPYLPTLKAAIENAKKRPDAVKYQEVSTAMQEAAYAALGGSLTVDAALKQLQDELAKLTEK